MDKQFLNLEYKKCFVGYIDLLRFKKIVEQEASASNISSRLEFLFKQISILSGCHDPSHIESKVRAILMSDTFLLYTKDDSLKSFQQLIGVIASFVNMGIENSMRIKKLENSVKLSFVELSSLFRGAISFGDFYADEEKGIYFGQSYNDAHDWEKKQEWIGIMLTPDCSDFVKSKEWQIGEHLLVEYDVPLKEKKYIGDDTYKIERFRKKSLCIDWTRNFSDYLIDPTFYDCAEEKYRDKYKNTYDFLIFCRQINKS